MADYRGNEAYRFELLQNRVVVPQETQTREILGPKYVVEQEPKTNEEAFREAKASCIKVAKIIVLSAILFGLIIGAIFSRAKLTMLAIDEENAYALLNEQKSESVRLNSALAQKMPMNEVEKYAVDKLGMVKGSSAQIIYINLNSDNAVKYYEGSKIHSVKAE